MSKDTIPNLFSVKDKIILISGAGRGIGRHLAHSMAKHSAFVYCIDKKFPKEIPKDVKKNMFNVKCDITNNRTFTKICQNIFKTHKKIDVLVNNAAVTFPSNKKEVFYPTKNKKIRTALNQRFFNQANPTLAASEKQRLIESISNQTGVNIIRFRVDKPKYTESLLTISTASSLVKCSFQIS